MTDSILSSKTFLTYSLGCRTNQAEIETIGEQLMVYGFRQYTSSTFLPFHSPALIILNTCVVTSKAEKETRKEMRYLRKKFPRAFLVVLGCAVTEKEKFNINLPEADLLISNEEKENAAEIVIKHFNKGPSLYKDGPLTINKYIQSGRKFIKIQDGCNGGCSFCLTQFVRGKPTSIPPEKIIEEINFWVERGVKEIILTGINIGLYGVIARGLSPKQSNSLTGLPQGKALRNDINFDYGTPIANLIHNILTKTKIERLSFSSIYPEMVSDKLLKIVVNNPRISQYFHLSLQSGSKTVLERMGRITDPDKLLKKLLLIKKQNPFFTFKADIITGFPEETEKEFQETLKFIQEARISFAHLFTYSPRKGTAAYEMIKSHEWQDLPEKIKKERAKKIRIVVKNIRKQEAKKMIAKLPARRNFSEGGLNCLIVRKGNSVIASKARYRTVPGEAWQSQPNYSNPMGLLRRSTPRNDNEIWEGITENGWVIKLSNYQINKLGIKNEIKGKIVPVKIIGFENDWLIGEILGK